MRLQKEECDSIYLDAIEANFSHEMNTPLNSILSNSNIILDSLSQVNVNSSQRSKKHYLECIEFMKNNQKLQ